MVINDIQDNEAIKEEYFKSGYVHIKTDPNNIEPITLKKIASYFGKYGPF